MSDDATPRLGLPYLAAAQAQKHVTLNAALGLLDGLVQTLAESRTIAAQPAAPTDGSVYILPASATGDAWAGRPAGALMRWEAGAWTALPSGVGQTSFLRDEGRLLVCTPAGWTDVAALLTTLQNLAALGVNTTADAANPLSVRGPAALLTHAGAGVQLKLNKATAADTASVLYQTGFSGRAEMGLCGDDRLHIKVSADGAGFTEAVVVDAAGRLQLGASLRVKTFAKAALPAASGEGAGAVAYVPDDAAGATLAFCDGATWRRVHDRQPVA